MRKGNGVSEPVFTLFDVALYFVSLGEQWNIPKSQCKTLFVPTVTLSECIILFTYQLIDQSFILYVDCVISHIGMA